MGHVLSCFGETRGIGEKEYIFLFAGYAMCILRRMCLESKWGLSFVVWLVLAFLADSLFSLLIRDPAATSTKPKNRYSFWNKTHIKIF